MSRTGIPVWSTKEFHNCRTWKLRNCSFKSAVLCETEFRHTLFFIWFKFFAFIGSRRFNAYRRTTAGNQIHFGNSPTIPVVLTIYCRGLPKVFRTLPNHFYTFLVCVRRIAKDDWRIKILLYTERQLKK